MQTKYLQKLYPQNNYLIFFENSNEKHTLFEKKLKNEKEGIFSPKPIKFFKKKAKFYNSDPEVTEFELDLFPLKKNPAKKNENEKTIVDLLKNQDFKFLKFPQNEENLINLEQKKNPEEKNEDFLFTSQTTIELDRDSELEENFKMDFSVKKKKKIHKKKKSRKLEDVHKLKIKMKKINSYWKKKIKHMPHVFKIKAKIVNSKNFVLQFLDFSSKKLLIRDDKIKSNVC